MKKKETKREFIDASKYVNIETGELLSDEQGNVYLEKVNKKDKNEDMVVVNYNEYVVIDSRAREFIQSKFSVVECGRIFQMCDMVKSCYNILFDKKTKQYHTKDTLMSDLDYSRNKYASFMKRLFEESIIYYIRGMKDGKECVWIMMNPTLARKSKFFHKDCTSVFDDLSKKSNTK